MTAYRAILGYLLGFAFGLIMLALLAGCSVYRTDAVTVIDIGTGNRGFIARENGSVHYWHGDIPATIREIVPLAEAAAKGLAEGAVKGATGKP